MSWLSNFDSKHLDWILIDNDYILLDSCLTTSWILRAFKDCLNDSDAPEELSKNLFEMFLYNYSVRKVSEEEMDINYYLSYEYDTNYNRIDELSKSIFLKIKILSWILLKFKISTHSWILLELKILLRELLNLDWQRFLIRLLNLDWHRYFKNTNLEYCLWVKIYLALPWSLYHI